MEAAARRLGVPEGALEGKVAVVTGGARGIGRAVALELAALGASVAVCDVRPAGEATIRDVQSAGGQGLYERADVSDERQTVRLARRVAATFGRADIIVNSASLAPVAAVSEMEVEDWDRTVRVNLRGTFLVCKAFLPMLLERHSGTILNMVSAEPVPFMSAYAATKLAVIGLTQSLAAEVGPEGVNVIALAPGIVDTPGLRGVAEKLPLRLGMEREDFLNMSMPARRAAEATGYLVTHAEEHHGEMVDGYRLLEHAASERAARDYAREHERRLVSESMRTTARREEFAEALRAVGRVRAMHEETRERMALLPPYVRPFARRTFSRKTGQSFAEWDGMLSHLAVVLERMESEEVTAEIGFRHLYPRVREALLRLSRYYHDAPDEAARFVRDKKARHALAERAARNEAEIGSLIELLETIRR